ncbi:MAG TPA: hypothetical protein VM618_01585 [Acidimicrobiia bacterium]|nr:hypothetical protein [Acidimicrobiia bacterium]
MGWAARFTLVCATMLLATGIWLAIAYEPGLAIIPVVHRVAAYGALCGLVGLVVVALGGGSGSRSDALVRILLLAAALLGGVATGLDLHWEQVAVDAAADRWRGVSVYFDDQVRFFIRDGHEVSKGAMQAEFWSHMAFAALGASWAGLLYVGRRGSRGEVSATM